MTAEHLTDDDLRRLTIIAEATRAPIEARTITSPKGIVTYEVSEDVVTLAEAARPLLARLLELQGVDKRLDAIAEAETHLVRSELRDLRDELRTEAEAAATGPRGMLASHYSNGKHVAYRDAAKRVEALLATLWPTEGGTP